DARVAELGHAAGLAQEAVAVPVRGEVAGAGDFDGDDSIQLRVAGLVHRAEGADADRLQQLEPAELPRFRFVDRGGGAALQGEAGAARRAQDLAAGVVHDLDRAVAVRAGDVHGGGSGTLTRSASEGWRVASL